MKTAAILAAGALLATSAFAAPGTEARWANHAERRAGRAGRRSGFKLPAEENGLEAVNGTDRNVEYSSNWAGAVLSSTGFTSVVGTIIVPTPKASGKSASASAWVGIDGEYVSPSLSFPLLAKTFPLRTSCIFTMSRNC